MQTEARRREQPSSGWAASHWARVPGLSAQRGRALRGPCGLPTAARSRPRSLLPSRPRGCVRAGRAEGWGRVSRSDSDNSLRFFRRARLGLFPDIKKHNRGRHPAKPPGGGTRFYTLCHFLQRRQSRRKDLDGRIGKLRREQRLLRKKAKN